MARGVKKEKETTKDKVVANVQSALDSFLNSSYKIKQCMVDKKEMAQTGIGPADLILGGGFPFGGITVLVGRPGSGKSAMAGNFLGECQRIHGDKLLSVYLDSEEAMSLARLYQLGVQNPPVNPYMNVRVEDVFKTIDAICIFKEKNNCKDNPCVIIWDSLAASITEKEEKAEDPKEVIGYKAKILAFLIPKYLNKLVENKIAFVIINQYRDKVSMGMFAGNDDDLKYMKQGKTTSGGNAPRFYAYHFIEFNDYSQIKEEEYGFRGNKVKMKAAKNKAFPPNIEAELIFDFSRGYVDSWSKFSVLAQEKILIASGPVWKLPGYYEGSFYKKNYETMFDTDPEFKDAINKAFGDYANEIKKKYGADIMEESLKKMAELKVEIEVEDSDIVDNIPDNIEDLPDNED